MIRRTVTPSSLRRGPGRVNARHFVARLRTLVARLRVTEQEEVVTLSEWVDELENLGLDADDFGWLRWAEALADHLEITIHLLPLQDEENYDVKASFLEDGTDGFLYRNPRTGTAVIFIASSLTPLEQLKLIYHELAHLAAGDPIPTKRLLGRSDRTGDRYVGDACGDPYVPSRRIARRRPSADPRVQELAADTRANYAITTEICGSEIYDREERFLGTS